MSNSHYSRTTNDRERSCLSIDDGLPTILGLLIALARVTDGSAWALWQFTRGLELHQGW